MIETKKSSFTYRSSLPFHPKRLHELLKTKDFFKGQIESHGTIWLASRFVFVGEWKGNSESFDLSSSGEIWLYQLLTGDHFQVAKDMEGKIQNEKNELIKSGKWNERYGDMSQEITFVGNSGEMSEEIIRKYLDNCLLTKEEQELGCERWPICFEDPFTQWMTEEEGHNHDHSGHEHKHDDHDHDKLQTIPSESIYMRLIRDISQIELVEKDEREDLSFKDIKDMRVFDVKFKVDKDVFSFHFKLASIYPQLPPKVTLDNFEYLLDKIDQSLIDKNGKLLLPLLNKKWRSFYDLNDVFQDIRLNFLKIEHPFQLKERNKLHYGVGKSYLKGQEKVMLDSFVVLENYKDANSSLVAVFDGFQKKIEVEDIFKSKSQDEYKVNESQYQEHVNKHKNSVSYYLSENLEKNFGNCFEKDGDRVEIMKKLFLEMEKDLSNNKSIDSINDGASSTVAFLEKMGEDRFITVSSFGDCLAFVIKSTKNKARLISDLHSLHNEQENKLICKDISEEEKKSELFQLFTKDEIPTRGFGFHQYDKYIKRDPYVNRIKVEDDDSMLIIASKGLWSCIPGIEIPMILNSQISPQQMSDDLVRTAKHRGCQSNVTCICICL